MLAFTSEQITAPFLLPEMVLSLCGPQSMLSLCFHYIFLFNLSHLVIMPSNIGLQVERVASMLNYFLLQLVGPQRRSLSLKDPEKYEFRPKELLKQVCKN